MRLELIERKTEVPGVDSFIFKPAEALQWKAGQFLHYVLHHEPTDDRGSDRWFTVASAPYENHVMITTRLTDENGSTFKKALQALKLGELIEISDTDGDFTIDNESQEFVFIAGGIGVTPFHSILKQFDHEGKSLHATLIYSNRDEYIPFKQEFDAFAQKNPALKIHYIVGGRIDEAKIRELVPDVKKPIFYVSGPEPMVDALSKTLKEMGVSESMLKGDWFPGYPVE